MDHAADGLEATAVAGLHAALLVRVNRRRPGEMASPSDRSLTSTWASSS
jgi:hypothetical protein